LIVFPTRFDLESVNNCDFVGLTLQLDPIRRPARPCEFLVRRTRPPANRAGFAIAGIARF
jgi:hypothetical protein